MGTIVKQLTQNLTEKEIKEAGLDTYYVAHGLGVYPSSASGVPFTAAYLQSKGDPITDLYEDMAAEQKARSTYEYLIDMTEDPDVLAPLRFLREREIVHFQRFGEALNIVRDSLNEEKTFMMGNTNNINWNNNNSIMGDTNTTNWNNNSIMNTMKVKSKGNFQNNCGCK